MLLQASAQLDPNWFYSSLAQCAAAVIGLLGAVLFARVQQQQLAAREVSVALRRATLDLSTAFGGVADSLERYGKFADIAEPAVRDALRRNQREIQLAQECTLATEQSGERPLTVVINQEYLEQMLHRRRVCGEIVEQLRVIEAARSFGGLYIADVWLKHHDAQLIDSDRDRDLLKPLITALRSAIDLGERLRAQNSIMLPLSITVLLLWLCIFGLIRPLWLLSAYPGTDKLSLLLAFSIGVLGIPLLLSYQLLELWRASRVAIKVSRLAAP
jgi:hypothetical protein